MSLLHQNSQEEIDDAAMGEELTKGTSHVVWATLIATVLVTAAILVYVWAGQKPPVVSGEVLQVWAHPVRSENLNFTNTGEELVKESFDQVLVFGRVRLHNQSPHPVLFSSTLCNITLDDGIHSSYAAGPNEYERIFRTIHGLEAVHGNPLPAEYNMKPGETLEGSFVTSFRMPREKWMQRRDMNFSFGFRYQPVLKLLPSGPVPLQ